MAELEPFAVELHQRDGVVTVRPRGELDVATVDQLRAVLDGVGDMTRLVLDLRALRFIDSTALHLLVALEHRASRDAFQLALLAPPPPVDRAIKLCGLFEMLPFVTAVDGEPGPVARDTTT